MASAGSFAQRDSVIGEICLTTVDEGISVCIFDDSNVSERGTESPTRARRNHEGVSWEMWPELCSFTKATPYRGFAEFSTETSTVARGKFSATTRVTT
jgi:hypothetical protein